MTIIPLHAPQVDAFLADLRAAVDEVRQAPSTGGDLLAMLSAIDLSQFDNGQIEELLTSTGPLANAGGHQPMAEVNQILDSLPAAETDRLVTSFFDLLSRPQLAAP